MVDEAHATGLYGPRRRGWAEACAVSDRIEIQMGTLGKALGSSGGYICGSRALIELLVNRARPFIFSTAPVPAAAGAAAAAIRLVRSEEGAKRCARLWERVREYANGVNGPSITAVPEPENADTLRCLSAGGQDSAIIPLILGDASKTVEAAARLRSQGVFIPAIRYPTVARGSASLRLTFTASHTTEDINHLVAALRRLDLVPDSEHEIPHSASKE
jgi:7-keto-8-aminopelargonate synthetase-like enzyme